MVPPNPPGKDGRPQRRDFGRDDDLFEILVSRIALVRPNQSKGAFKDGPGVGEEQGNFDLDQNDDDATSGAMEPHDQTERVPWLTVQGARSFVSIVLLIGAVGGASALLAWAMLRPGTTPMAHELETTTASPPAAARAPAPIFTQQTESIKSARVDAVPDRDRTLLSSSEQTGGRRAPIPDSQPGQRAEGNQPMSNQPTNRVEPATPAVAPSPPVLQPSSGELSALAEAAPQFSAEHQATASVSGRQPKPAPALSLDAEEITALIEHGSDYLKRGDLASARLLLGRAAEAGSADAALMLGSTFDPLFIQQLGAIGIEPDVARARQWYQKAAELGSDAASQRLANLKNP